MKKIILIIAITIISVYLILLVAPIFIKNHFNNNSEKYLGRKANMEKLTFNPFNCAITSENLQVLEKDQSTIFSGYRELYVNVNFLKLVTGKYQLEEVTLDSPYVKVINNSGIFNFNDLISDEEDEAETEEEDSEIAFEILNLRMDNGLAIYYETEIDHEVIMDDLSFQLPRFAYDSHSANMDIEFVINETGLLRMKNDFFPDESRFECLLNLRNLNLDIVEPYAPDYLIVNDIRGNVHGDVSVTVEFKDSTNVQIKGQSWLTDVALIDSAKTPLFTVDSLGLDISSIDVSGERYEVKKVFADNFFLRFDMFDSTNNMLSTFAPLINEEQDTLSTGQMDDSLAAKTPAKYFYSVDTFLVVNSNIQYRDYSLDEYFQYDITSIEALADNIRSDNDQAKIGSNGILNEKGNYNANMEFNPSNPLDFELDFVVEGFQMEDLSPFTLTYAGHPIFEGDLIYSGHTTVLNGVMESENNITVYELTVGDRVSKNVLYAMPLKFAVFLLKDKDGVVNLDLPVGGNLNDPKFKLGPIIWQVIKQNIVKIAAAPGKLLASQFGMKEEDIRYMSFDPLDTALQETSQNTLNKLGELIQKKPGLKIELAYYEPSNLEAVNFALYETKKEYIDEKFIPVTPDKEEDRIQKLDDDDIHYRTYLNQKAGTEDRRTDSLSVEMIGMDNLIPKTRELENSRKDVITQFIDQMDSVSIESIEFVELESIPKFPIEKSGFVVDFSIK